MELKGIWLPLITPFKEDTPDLESLNTLIEYGIRQGVSGFVLLGTTAETPTLSEDEMDLILKTAFQTIDKRVPVLVGAGSNDTKKTAARLKYLDEAYDPDGFLVVSPYYNRPDQRGIIAHFEYVAKATTKPIILYNIPYRTGRNMENATIRKLASIPNIVGLKDACGDIHQSLDLLLNPPEDFAILCGEDAFFYTMMLHGASGGILASAHIETSEFIEVYDCICQNSWRSALPIWNYLTPMIQLLFKEPNPAPAKYCLKRLGLIENDEVRLPLVGISGELKILLNQSLQNVIPYSSIRIV